MDFIHETEVRILYGTPIWLIGNCSAIFAPLRQLFRFESEGWLLKVVLAVSS
jgi:hypothetical protein